MQRRLDTIDSIRSSSYGRQIRIVNPTITMTITRSALSKPALTKPSAARPPQREPRSVVLRKPAVMNARKPDVITGFNGRIGDILVVDLKSFGIDPLLNPGDDKRANIGFGTCAAAINKGARNSEAFLYQTRTGQLFFNANGSDPGLGEGGGVIWVFKGAPALGVYFDRTGSGTLPF